jgi:hypothetical protein
VTVADAEIAIGRLDSARADRVVRAFTSTALLGSILAFVTWPIVSIAPASGPDLSWIAGLYMAGAEGLQFGTEIVFTYGPLGFLQVPVLYDGGMWVGAFLFQAAMHAMVAISLLWVARRALPLALALPACYCLLVIGGLSAAAVLLAFLWCFVVLGDEPPRFALPAVAIAGGLLAAVELPAKANYGIAIFLFAMLALLGVPGRRRHVPLFLVVTAAGLVVGWVAGGQALSAAPDFIGHAAQIVSGYSGAMGTDVVVRDWELPLAGVAIVLLLSGAVLAARRDPLPRRIASLALVALFSFMAFKQGFVRQGVGNTPEFFVLIAGAAIAVASRLPRAPLRGPALGLVGSLVALALIVLPTPSLWQSLQPDSHLRFLRQDVDALLHSAERGRLIAEARRSMRSAYRLDPEILSALGDSPVHIDPWEIGVAWAYGLNWRPLPVIQSYSAYTPQLDRLNAAALGGPAAPAAILRHRDAIAGVRETSIDDRLPGWESPAAARAMLCNYRPVRTTARWQLLERAENRCGAPRPIEAVRAASGDEISIPPPPGRRDMVFARVEGLGIDGWEGVRTALYRARERTATLAGRSWRVVPETAPDGLVMRIPPAVDFPRPFGLAPDSATISFGVDGAARPLTIEFFAQRVGRPRAVARTPGRGEAPAAQPGPDRGR